MHDVTVGIPDTFTFENALASVSGCKGPTGRYTLVSVRPAPQKRGVWSESGQIHPYICDLPTNWQCEWSMERNATVEVEFDVDGQECPSHKGEPVASGDP